jgi:hypothetical protein
LAGPIHRASKGCQREEEKYIDVFMKSTQKSQSLAGGRIEISARTRLARNEKKLSTHGGPDMWITVDKP